MEGFGLKYAVIEITKKCNLRCVHCGSGCTGTSGKELDIDEWKKVISQFSELGVERVVFSGGEPTLKKGIEALFAYLHQLGINYGIISNGFKMEEQLIGSLSRYKPFAVGFSVDGGGKIHNKIRQNEKSWENCLDSIAKIKQAGIPVSIVTTLNQWNYDELGYLANFVNYIRADCWQIQLTFPTGRAKEQTSFLVTEEMFAKTFNLISFFRRQYPNVRIEAADCFAFADAGLIRDNDWYGCQAGITSIGIDAEGNVMPCLAMRLAAFCGNVKDKPLKEIWKNSDKFDFNRKFDPDSVSGNCRDCKILEYCRGGCGSFSLSYNGVFHDAPFCHFRELLRDC